MFVRVPHTKTPIPEDRAKGMPSVLVPSHTPQASRATEPRALDNRTDHLPAGLGGTSLVRSEFPSKLKTSYNVICRINLLDSNSTYRYAAAAAAAKSFQSCPILCDPINGSPPGFPVPGILQARTLEWVAISFSSA